MLLLDVGYPRQDLLGFSLGNVESLEKLNRVIILILLILTSDAELPSSI